MKKAFIVLSILFSLGSYAQRGYSISVDADENQFFSVAIGKKIYPSSSIGHLLITGLKDSTYQLVISFPRSNYTAESFPVAIDKRDRKFQLKKIGEKQWNLQDLQANTWVKQKSLSSQSVPVKSEAELARSRDAFKKLMAAVVNDTAILNTEVEVQMPKKEVLVKSETAKEPNNPPDTNLIRSPIKNDTTIIVQVPPPTLKESASDSIVVTPIPVTDTVENIGIKEVAEKKIDSSFVQKEKNQTPETVRLSVSDTVIQAETIKFPGVKEKDSIVKLYELNLKDSKEIVYITRDSTGEKDTIRIELPIEKDSESMKPKDEIKKPELTVPSLKNDSVILAPKKPDLKADTVVRKLVVVNSDCKNFASEADLDKLRVKMISENRMDERVQVARKYFKTRCFTTRQIRALTELFVSDKTRYEFFDAAYPFVSDTANFKSLLDLLTDEYYIGRFKAMVRIVE